MSATMPRSQTVRHELIGLAGVVERNVYLTRRYFLWDVAFLLWTIANTLTIVFISRGIDVPPAEQNALATKFLIGGVIWAYLGIIFEIVTETVAWERWEGTIEYTFMAPVSRPVHLFGMGIYAVLYGIVRASILFVAVVAFIGIHLDNPNYPAALALLAIASISFIGIGMMTAVLPLISPEKGMQLGFIAQGLMLVVSGVYYSVEVLPEWMQWIAKISPATYALRGIRDSIIDGAGLAWGDVWPLLLIGAVSVPLGLVIFRAGERYAKQHGKLEEVRVMEIRPAASDADLAAWIEVRRAILPNERAATVDALRDSTGLSHALLLLAEAEGEVAGSGLARPSDLEGIGFVAPRVLPGFRRCGIGTALLKRLTEHVHALGFATASAAVDEPELLPFAERFGFREVDRQVEQARAVAPEEPWPSAPEGIELVRAASRPGLVREAYETVGREAFEDIPVGAPIVVSSDEWEVEWLAPASSVVALAGGDVVGCAGLLLDETTPTRAEHGLTAVRRDHRRRGVATALKLATLALASERGVREVYTWTQRGNEAMRRLNERLGYAVRSQSIRLQAPLPLGEERRA